ncbi:hypothetical protein AURDEDRAFT_163351 [Auricularia subglabra TFB-10046 SS5]|nr:hypothetical protein AURDEDRAFT_163351 [Auricularia subglabra TFB-10046 SS5]
MKMMTVEVSSGSAHRDSPDAGAWIPRRLTPQGKGLLRACPDRHGPDTWAGQPLDPLCTRCVAKTQTCHAHKNGSGYTKLACFECNTARVACSLSQKAADRKPGPDAEQPDHGGRFGRPGVHLFGPRSVQEAANSARADANGVSNAAVCAAVEKLGTIIGQTNGLLSRLCAALELRDDQEREASSAGQKRKRPESDR